MQAFMRSELNLALDYAISLPIMRLSRALGSPRINNRGFANSNIQVGMVPIAANQDSLGDAIDTQAKTISCSDVARRFQS
jgi:hypothetical protein